MDRIKREVPIWKCEERPDGRRDWIHPELRPDGGGRDGGPSAADGERAAGQSRGGRRGRRGGRR